MGNILDRESSISRFLQIRVPSVNSDGTVSSGYTTESESAVSRMDTTDKDIIDNLTKATITKNYLYNQNYDVFDFLNNSKEGIEIKEDLPASDKTLYNKAFAVFDKDKMSMLFDYSGDAESKRIHLHHPKGSYWTINGDGSYIEKYVGGFKSFILNDMSQMVRGKYNLLSRSDINIETRKNLSTTAIESFTVLAGSDYKLIGGGSFEDITGTKNIASKGFYVDSKSLITLKSGDVILDAKDGVRIRGGNISFEAGLIDFDIGSNLTQTVAGSFELGGGSLILAGSDNLSISSGGNATFTTIGYSKEIINNSPPYTSLDTYGKEIKVTLGGYKVDVNLGNITMNTLAGNVDVSTILGNVDVGTKAGNVSISTLLGNVETTTLLGSAKMGNAIGSVTVNPIGLGNIKSATGDLKGFLMDLMLKIDTFITTFDSHNHIAPLGPTSPPVLPAIADHLAFNIEMKAKLLLLLG